MKKAILFTVLFILFLAFAVLIFNAYTLQKNYLNNKDTIKVEDTTSETDDNLDIPSLYTDYSKENYDMSLSDKRILVLYFTSNWCQECITQDVLNAEAFSELNKEGVVGLRIHILDSETTEETGALAKKFDITKEQSFVILDKSGAVKFKHVGVLTSEVLKQEIMKLR